MFLEKHDKKGSAGVLSTSMTSLIKSPDNIEAWMFLQIGKENIRHQAIMKSEKIYHAVMLGLMQDGENEFALCMRDYLRKYRPCDLKFLISGRHDFVWGAGLKADELEEGLKLPMGQNLYGKLLYRVFL